MKNKVYNIDNSMKITIFTHAYIGAVGLYCKRKNEGGFLGRGMKNTPAKSTGT